MPTQSYETIDLDITGRLAEIVGINSVKVNEPMSEHTTFKIGGPVEWFVKPQSIDQIQSIMRFCNGYGIPVHVMGLGSDVLVCDEGMLGVVVQTAAHFKRIYVEGTMVHALAGASNADVAAAAQRAGLTGYEFASGIPGTVGGAAVMNAGAYDGEFAQVCTSVLCLAPYGSVVEIPAAQADWSYRHSMMAEEGYVVLGVRLQLVPGDPDEIQARMDDLAQRRADKQPLDMPSAGSTFKRPVGHYAGALIQEAGMQGHAHGGAQVSTKHAGFVVNTGGATAQDVCHVISDVMDAVKEHSGVDLEPEVKFWC